MSPMVPKPTGATGARASTGAGADTGPPYVADIASSALALADGALDCCPMGEFCDMASSACAFCELRPKAVESASWMPGMDGAAGTAFGSDTGAFVDVVGPSAGVPSALSPKLFETGVEMPSMVARSCDSEVGLACVVEIAGAGGAEGAATVACAGVALPTGLSRAPNPLLGDSEAVMADILSGACWSTAMSPLSPLLGVAFTAVCVST